MYPLVDNGWVVVSGVKRCMYVPRSTRRAISVCLVIPSCSGDPSLHSKLGLGCQVRALLPRAYVSVPPPSALSLDYSYDQHYYYDRSRGTPTTICTTTTSTTTTTSHISTRTDSTITSTTPTSEKSCDHHHHFWHRQALAHTCSRCCI